MTVGRLLDEIDSYELTEWMAFHKNMASDDQRRQLRDKAAAGVAAHKPGRHSK